MALASSFVSTIPAAVGLRRRKTKDREQSSASKSENKKGPGGPREVHFPNRKSQMLYDMHKSTAGSRSESHRSMTKKKGERTVYVPKKSKRIAKRESSIVPDGNTWVELRVESRKTPEKSRSLFYSIHTRNAFWDEPPTGASEVVTLGDMERLRNVIDKVEKEEGVRKKCNVVEEGLVVAPNTPSAPDNIITDCSVNIPEQCHITVLSPTIETVGTLETEPETEPESVAPDTPESNATSFVSTPTKWRDETIDTSLLSATSSDFGTFDLESSSFKTARPESLKRETARPTANSSLFTNIVAGGKNNLTAILMTTNIVLILMLIWGRL